MPRRRLFCRSKPWPGSPARSHFSAAVDDVDLLEDVTHTGRSVRQFARSISGRRSLARPARRVGYNLLRSSPKKENSIWRKPGVLLESVLAITPREEGIVKLNATIRFRGM
jgi:hypothetical protein